MQLTSPIKERIHQLSEQRAKDETTDNLESFLSYYDANAISMPEFQPTLHGINEIEEFYRTIFQRQNVKSLKRKADEVIVLDSVAVELGSFTKEYSDPDADSVKTHNGKYWNIWRIQTDGSLKIKGEAFGFFHPVNDPKAHTVRLKNKYYGESLVPFDKEIPLELRAYSALTEKQVMLRDGVGRSEFYTNDAVYMPFQEPSVTGMNEIKPYLIEYSNRGVITFDSIGVYTYHAESIGNHILEYSKFKVKWRTTQSSGRTEGKGIRLWKRLDDGSIRIFRHIGTHNHLQ